MNDKAASQRVEKVVNELRAAGWPSLAEDITDGLAPNVALTRLDAMGEGESEAAHILSAHLAAGQTWTFMGHWEGDRIVVEYHVAGVQEDPRVDHGVWEQGLWADSGSGATVEEAQRNAVEPYEHEHHTDPVEGCRLCAGARPSRKHTPTFHYLVTVEADTSEQADQVMAERLGVDEDYGFDYSVDWGYWSKES